MGLKEVVRRIAQEMVADDAAEGLGLSGADVARVERLLRGFSRRLADCVDAAEGPTPPVRDNPIPTFGHGGLPREAPESANSPDARQAFMNMAAISEKVHAVRNSPGAAGGQRMWECVGGNMDGVSFLTDGDLPEGKRLWVPDPSGEVYYRDGPLLRFDVDATARELEKRTRPKAQPAPHGITTPDGLRPPRCGVQGHDLECEACGVRLYGRDVEGVCRYRHLPRRGRTRSQVLAARQNAAAGGCCDRFADNQACDCLVAALPD